MLIREVDVGSVWSCYGSMWRFYVFSAMLLSSGKLDPIKPMTMTKTMSKRRQICSFIPGRCEYTSISMSLSYLFSVAFLLECPSKAVVLSLYCIVASTLDFS